MKQETQILTDAEEQYQLDKDREQMAARRTARIERDGKGGPLPHAPISSCSCPACQAAISAGVIAPAVAAQPPVTHAKKKPGRPPRTAQDQTISA